MKRTPRDYLLEDRLYRDVYRRGKAYCQHEPGDPCAEDLVRLFSWASFPGECAPILELGCGDGFHTAVLARMGLKVTGVDCSPAAVARSHEHLAAAGIQATSLVADACDLRILGAGSFPFVLDSHCLHCITDYGYRGEFLAQVRFVLQEGGTFFLATMGAQPMEWTRRQEEGRWLSRFGQDERGCWVQSCVPPGCSRRVTLRIWVTEQILREELAAAGLEVVRFETFRSEQDPVDLMFLAEVRA